MQVKKLLGKKIKNIRTKKGLTQEKLAELVNISQRTLSGIEIGENFLTAETLEKILKVLDVTLDEIFTTEHLKPSEELKGEIINDIKSLSDEEKIRTIYKIIKAYLKD